MSDTQLLLLVLVLLYLAECAVFIRRDGVAFTFRLLGHGKVVRGGGLYGNDQKGVFLANPVPRLGSVLITQSWPMSLSPEGVFSYVGHAPNPGSRAPHLERYVAFDDVRKIEIESSTVHINGEPFLRAQLPQIARRCARIIRTVKECPPEARAAAIDAELRRAGDRTAVRRRVAQWRSAARPLHALCDLLFVYLLVITPAVVVLEGLAKTWWVLLIVLLLLLAAITTTYVLAHRRLHPDAGADRFSHAMTMALFPPAALRAHDRVSRELLADFDPLAVVLELCPKATAREFAGQVMRDLRWPLEPVCPAESAAACRTEAFFRERFTEATTRLLRESGFEPDELVAPPVPQDPDSRSYCPRCHCEFLVESGVCGACADRPLEPLARAEAVSV